MTGAILVRRVSGAKAEKKIPAKKVRLSSRRMCGEEGPVERQLGCRGDVHVPLRLWASSSSYLKLKKVKCFLSDNRAKNDYITGLSRLLYSPFPFPVLSFDASQPGHRCLGPSGTPKLLTFFKNNPLYVLAMTLPPPHLNQPRLHCPAQHQRATRTRYR
jgi:hypothetical protein